MRKSTIALCANSLIKGLVEHDDPTFWDVIVSAIANGECLDDEVILALERQDGEGYR